MLYLWRTRWKFRGIFSLSTSIFRCKWHVTNAPQEFTCYWRCTNMAINRVVKQYLFKKKIKRKLLELCVLSVLQTTRRFRKSRGYWCELILILLMWRIGWATKSISIYIQQDATLHSLFISGNCSTCLGWYFHPSSGAHTTVCTASGICHTVTAICRYRGRDGTGLSVLWVAYATHSTLKPAPTLPR
jgi:hypothetical protein